MVIIFGRSPKVSPEIFAVRRTKNGREYAAPKIFVRRTILSGANGREWRLVMRQLKPDSHKPEPKWTCIVSALSKNRINFFFLNKSKAKNMLGFHYQAPYKILHKRIKSFRLLIKGHLKTITLE